MPVSSSPPHLSELSLTRARLVRSLACVSTALHYCTCTAFRLCTHLHPRIRTESNARMLMHARCMADERVECCHHGAQEVDHVAPSLPSARSLAQVCRLAPCCRAPCWRLVACVCSPCWHGACGLWRHVAHVSLHMSCSRHLLAPAPLFSCVCTQRRRRGRQL